MNITRILKLQILGFGETILACKIAARKERTVFV